MIYGIIPTLETFPGVHGHLSHGERIGLWREIPLRDINKIGGEDVALFGAWSDQYSLPLRRLRCHKKGILWTSPLAQSEMSQVELAVIVNIKAMLIKGTLDFVMCAHPDMVEVFGEGSFHGPHPVHLRDIPRVEKMEGHASLFGPCHPRKNIANQMVVAKREGLTLHTGYLWPQYMDFANAIGLALIEYSWIPEDDYFKTVASMELGLQCSHMGVESFDYVVWDHLTMGVPCLTTVPWVPTFLQVQDPSSIDEIGESVYDLRRNGYPPNLREWCEQFAKKQNAEVKEALKNL